MTQPTKTQIEQAESIINRWESHLGKYSPGANPDRYSFGPPATAQDYARFEKKFEFPFPAELTAIYNIHNGSVGNNGLLCGYEFCNINDMIAYRSCKLELHKEGIIDINRVQPHLGNPYGIPPHSWSKSWIPILATHKGTHVFIDMNPDQKNGQIGQCFLFAKENIFEPSYFVFLGKNVFEFLKKWLDLLDQEVIEFDQSVVDIFPNLNENVDEE
jgi:cell wall assembly regulator SMI1